ncbi:unnamed protein product, partial [Ixodes pacificus]
MRLSDPSSSSWAFSDSTSSFRCRTSCFAPSNSTCAEERQHTCFCSEMFSSSSSLLSVRSLCSLSFMSLSSERRFLRSQSDTSPCFEIS